MRPRPNPSEGAVFGRPGLAIGSTIVSPLEGRPRFDQRAARANPANVGTTDEVRSEDGMVECAAS